MNHKVLLAEHEELFNKNQSADLPEHMKSESRTLRLWLKEIIRRIK
jgi:hypothetical protein